MPLTTFGNGSLLGERLGDRPRVLALHGWQRDRRDFATALDHVDAIAVDLPGFGASPPPPEGWGSARYAEAVLPVLHEFADPPVVVGHSFGGRVALHLAAEHPDLVRALVLSGVPLLRPPGGGPRPALRYRILRGLHRRGLLSDERFGRVRSRYGSADYRAATGVMRDVLVRVVNESYEQQLRAIACPVELLWGEDDTAAPLHQAQTAAGLLADAHVTIIPGGDHFACFRQPDLLRDAVARCLA